MSLKPPSVEYRPDEGESLSTAILAALSEAKGRDVSEDDCVLYDSIDTEAVDRLFREEGGEDSIKVEFVTHNALVILWGNGQVTIEVQDLANESQSP